MIGATAALVVERNPGRVEHEALLMATVSAALAISVVAHGLALGRPLTGPHVGFATAVLVLALIAGTSGHPARVLPLGVGIVFGGLLLVGVSPAMAPVAMPAGVAGAAIAAGVTRCRRRPQPRVL